MLFLFVGASMSAIRYDLNGGLPTCLWYDSLYTRNIWLLVYLWTLRKPDKVLVSIYAEYILSESDSSPHPWQRSLSVTGDDVSEMCRPHPLLANPLFVLSTDGNPLMSLNFSHWVKDQVAIAGSENSQYSGHPWDMEAHVSHTMLGVPGDTIRSLGNWASNTYTAYVLPERHLIAHAVQLITLERDSMGHSFNETKY